MNQTDQSNEAKRRRLITGLGPLLSHFLHEVGEELGHQFVPGVTGFISSNRLREIVSGSGRSLLIPDPQRVNYFTNYFPQRETDLIGFGTIYERIKVVGESREEENYAFEKWPRVQEQTKWIINLLNRIGIDVGDANLVYSNDGRVVILDLDQSGICLPGKEVIYGSFDPFTAPAMIEKLTRTGAKNTELAAKARLPQPK